VTLGLFAKQVVIPICDGHKPERDFKSLLDGLHQEFKPVGFYEEWLVVKIAEYMWRLRRATRCESGSVRESAIWSRLGEASVVRPRRWDDNQHILDVAGEIGTLSEAEEQIRNSGTLTQKLYSEMAPLVEAGKHKASQAEKDNRGVETEFDHDLFLTCITDRKEFLETYYAALNGIEGDRCDSRYDYNSLVSENDMNRILRYEERMHRQIDWAVQRLPEAQERRKTVDSSPDAAEARTGQNEERRQ
jgi:hypothetical protein